MKSKNNFTPQNITIPLIKFIIRSIFTLNLLLKIEITKVNPENHIQKADATPDINGMNYYAVGVT